ncbi:hypothetical protein [Burkholderia sp. Ac-20365]|uniref:hypothetical protein n=1 Tax=Burkholderia sp. Ac-20365 TaxID=2703897 RepID=UPI00197BD497|nr:hypothetical protein [Burkholderia sp. Ac-20365]MBN3761344.1 hypothetical protein [Burkholderia sp. Ac-20365]
MNKAIPTLPVIQLPLSVVSTLIAMASQHVEDIETGIEDKIYSTADNVDLPEKKNALEHAEQAVQRASTADTTSSSTDPVEVRFNGHLSDVIDGLTEYYRHLPACKAALAMAVRSTYRDTGNAQADYTALRDQVEMAYKSLADGAVLGFDKDGTVLQWNAPDQTTYNSGENLDEYGIHNLREEELALVHVSVDTWQQAVRAHNGATTATHALPAVVEGKQRVTVEALDLMIRETITVFVVAWLDENGGGFDYARSKNEADALTATGLRAPAGAILYEFEVSMPFGSDIRQRIADAFYDHLVSQEENRKAIVGG